MRTRVSLVYCKAKHSNIQARTQYYSQLARPFTCSLRRPIRKPSYWNMSALIFSRLKIPTLRAFSAQTFPELFACQLQKICLVRSSEFLSQTAYRETAAPAFVPYYAHGKSQKYRYRECQKSQRLRTLFKLIVSFFSEICLLFSCLIFCGLARGPPGTRGPRFIEPPEPPVATPLPGLIAWLDGLQTRF